MIVLLMLVPIAAGAAGNGAGRLPLAATGAEACSAEPGAIVHDDGTYESGFGGYFEVIDSSEFVERFTPSLYPATISAVCAAFSVTGPGVTDFEFNVRFYDDDGDDGGPGTLLGSVPAGIDVVPPYVFGAEGAFVRVDTASSDIVVPDGAVYIGVEWDDMAYPGNFLSINSDAWSGGPFAGGYYRNTTTPWTPMYWAFLSDYRALQIRAVERAVPPRLGLVRDQPVIRDACAGYENGVAEPGEIVDLGARVRGGGGDFSGVVASLMPPAPAGVEYLLASAAIGAIDDGEDGEASFRIQLDADVGCLEDLVLPVLLHSDQGDFDATLRVPVGRALADIAPRQLPLKIPNRNDTGLASTIDVPQSGTIEHLAVDVGLDHYTVADLIVRLTSPAGTTITLLDRPGYPPFPGCENSVGDIRFEDGAPDPESICAEPPGGTPWPVDAASPVDPLSTFDGEDMQGTWTLTVIDAEAANAGALVRWSLDPTPALADVCTVCTADHDRIFHDGFDGR
ncbi:MAG TPA: proprotein convertase P-domain-containing protein [Rhodanobacteraceae bacterium]|nr:proprotein convertase P-domain-containing protein [Rhodanobacteraceae bacterium]